MRSRLFFAARAADPTSYQGAHHSFVIFVLGYDSVTCSRYLWSITLLVLCHPQMHSQVLTKALPAQAAAQTPPRQNFTPADNPAVSSASNLPDAPSQLTLPVATLQPLAPTGTPVRWESRSQSRNGDDWTLDGEVVLYYKNYVIHADQIVYHQDTSNIDATGHLQVEGGENDTILTADHGRMNVDDHTAAFYDVTGSFGVRRIGKVQVYSTPDPFMFTGRVLLQTGENAYRIVDGSMTSCRLPKPDWQLISHSIEVANNKATTRNSLFEVLRLPVFYLPFVQRSLDATGRESGFLLPIFANSGVKGLVLGEEYYWAINRSMDMTLGSEYWSKRGFAPFGDFRYKGRQLDGLSVRWSALLDRGLGSTITAADGTVTTTRVNQGGADILAYGRKDFTPNTRVAGSVEYLSSYIYRLAFDENLAQATSSEVQSELAFTHQRRGYIPSLYGSRFQSFAGSSNSETTTGASASVTVPEVRVLHLPSARFDVLDRPLAIPMGHLPPLYWGLGSSLGDLDRAEPNLHARNVGRFDLYPHLDWPMHLGEWQVDPQIALRTTQYSGSQIPDLTGSNFGVPSVQHNALNRSDFEASVDIRPPALERDFNVARWNRQLRHVIEPEIFYRYVTGIDNARQTLHFDTTDIVTDTNYAGFSLTQRLYLKPRETGACVEPDPQKPVDAKHPDPVSTGELEPCKPQPREWASWQIAQKYFIDPSFGGALIPDRRNVFESTLDMTGVAYLTSPRNIAPLISRLRFEAIDKLRIEWDFDYDTKAGRVGADNIFAGYSFGRTTLGLSHALLNAADENGSKASLIQSQQVQPFLYFGKPADVGLSVAMTASYDFTQDAIQYGGVQAIYNWNCCGINVGYRRFALGTLRDESEWLWGITLSGIGTAGNIRRSTSIFPTTDMINRLY